MTDERKLSYPGLPPVIGTHLMTIEQQLGLPMTTNQMMATGLAFMGMARTMFERAQAASSNPAEAYLPRHQNQFIDGCITAFAGNETINPTTLLTDPATLAAKKDCVIRYLHSINGNIPFSRLPDLSVYYLAELVASGKDSFEITGASIGQLIRESAHIKETNDSYTHREAAKAIIGLIGAGILWFPDNDYHQLQFADLDRVRALRPVTDFMIQRFINALMHKNIITVEGAYSLSKLDLLGMRNIGDVAIAQAEKQCGPFTVQSDRYLEQILEDIIQ